MGFLAPRLLEPSRPPLTTRPPPQPGYSTLFKEGAGWASGLEMGPHKESFCVLQLLLGAPGSLPGSPPALREQFALPGPRQHWPSCLLSPCPAAVAVGQPLWLAFLAACWAALGEGRGLTLGPQSECAAPCRDPGDENSSQ